MKKTINLKQILIAGSVAGIAAFLVGSLLYMNPLVANIYAENTWIGSKSMESFGGMLSWTALMGLGGIVSTIFLAALYSFTEKGIPIKSVWKKGAFFGILMWFVVTLPIHYNIWLMYTYPSILLMIETINSLIGSVVAGIILALVFEKIR